MNISVEMTPALLEFLDEKVREGMYKSRSEAVRNAVRLMIQADLARALRKAGLTPGEFRRVRKDAAEELLAGNHPELL